MRAKIVLISGSLLIAGIAVTFVMNRAATEPMPTVPFSGSEASLEVLSTEAKRCGITHEKIDRMGKFLVLAVQTPGASDPAFRCLVGWVIDHPRGGIGFLGNGATANPAKH